MKNSRKAILATVAALAGATGLASWAADPYYEGYTYDRYGNRYDRYGNAEPYYYFDGRRFNSERDYRNYRDFRRRESRRDFRDFDGDGVPDAPRSEADCAEPAHRRRSRVRRARARPDRLLRRAA